MSGCIGARIDNGITPPPPPPIGGALVDQGMVMIGEYITICHNSLAQYITMWNLFDIVMVEVVASRIPGDHALVVTGENTVRE